MRRINALALGLTMAIGMFNLTGCGGSSTAPKPSTPANPGTGSSTTAPAGDEKKADDATGGGAAGDAATGGGAATNP